MTFKEMLFFCTDILMLNTDLKNKSKVEQVILSGVNWQLFVSFSTSYYILPALYSNLKKAKLLQLLPKDLVLFMADIYSQNKKQNLRLYAEVLEINELLLAHNIPPIFLKGSAHLLLNLYGDLAERMIGDIDFLVAPNQMLKAAEVLEQSGYVPMSKFDITKFKQTKHYPRMVHKNKLMAIEIHKDVISNVNNRQLNFSTIDLTKQQVNNVFVPSFSNLVVHNAMNTQMNDRHYLFGKINLRQQYDFFLLANRVDVNKVLCDFKFHRRKLEAYLVKTSTIFKNTHSLRYPKNIRSFFVRNRVLGQFEYPKTFKYINACTFFFTYLIIHYQSFLEHMLKSSSRKLVINKVKDLDWWKHFLKKNYKLMFSN
jgi:hypothetical protein